MTAFVEKKCAHSCPIYGDSFKLTGTVPTFPSNFKSIEVSISVKVTHQVSHLWALKKESKGTNARRRSLFKTFVPFPIGVIDYTNQRN